MFKYYILTSLIIVICKISMAAQDGSQTDTLPPLEDPFKWGMVLVPGGSFNIGSTGGENDHFPKHRVTIDSFYIGATEVTQAQWQAVMGNNPSKFNDCPDCPVENISWRDAQAFLAKLNAATGKHYRLPTDAEWEFAARGGNRSKLYQYSGSNDPNAVAWHRGNSGQRTHPVASLIPNELGLYDMSGNVWEFCSDWYAQEAYYRERKECSNPQGPTRGEGRVLRGASHTQESSSASVKYRSSAFEGWFLWDIGFRVVRPCEGP